MKLITFAATVFAIAIGFSNSAHILDKSDNDLIGNIREALVNLDMRISNLEQPEESPGHDVWRTAGSYEVQFLPNSEGISVNLPIQDTEKRIARIEFDFQTANQEGVLLHTINGDVRKIYIDDGKLHFSLIEDSSSPVTVKNFISDDEWHNVKVTLTDDHIGIQVDEIYYHSIFHHNYARSLETVMFGADLFNSSDKFIGKMKNVELNSTPMRLSNYFNVKSDLHAYQMPEATSVILKGGEMISFQFSSDYYTIDKTRISNIIPGRPAEFYNKIEIKFSTSNRNRTLFRLLAPNEQYFNVRLDLNGFLKLEFRWNSRKHEFVIGKKHLADGNPHLVQIEIKHLGPKIIYQLDRNQREEIIFGPRHADDGYGIPWSTLILGSNGTGFSVCFISFKFDGDDLLKRLANLSSPSDMFESLQTFPRDFKRITCSGRKPDFNVGIGTADDGHNGHHKHHDHDLHYQHHDQNQHQHHDHNHQQHHGHNHQQHHGHHQQHHGHHHQQHHGCHEVHTAFTKSDDDYEKKYFDAFCDVRPNTALPLEKRRDVRGRVAINYEVSHVQSYDQQHQSDDESNATITVKVMLRGLLPQPDVRPSSFYTVGMHIHEFGNLSNGCESTGSHFNPFSASHGSPHSHESHYGDLGNIVANSRGVVDTTLVIHRFGDILEPIPYIGKALVIHGNDDDLGLNVNSTGSKVHGNAGPRIACCVIYAIKGHHP